jgi:hypothetical protein
MQSRVVSFTVPRRQDGHPDTAAGARARINLIIFFFLFLVSCQFTNNVIDRYDASPPSRSQTRGEVG